MHVASQVGAVVGRSLCRDVAALPAVSMGQAARTSSVVSMSPRRTDPLPASAV